MVSKQLCVDYETVVMRVLKRLIQIFCIFKDTVLIIRTAICISELIYNIRLWKSSPCKKINVDGNSEKIIFKFGSNVNNGIESQCLLWITCSVAAHSGYTLFGRRQSIPLLHIRIHCIYHMTISEQVSCHSSDPKQLCLPLILLLIIKSVKMY
jgi:hypothetical protein